VSTDELQLRLPARWSSPNPRKRNQVASMHAWENAAMASRGEVSVSADALITDSRFDGLRGFWVMIQHKTAMLCEGVQWVGPGDAAIIVNVYSRRFSLTYRRPRAPGGSPRPIFCPPRKGAARATRQWGGAAIVKTGRISSKGTSSTDLHVNVPKSNQTEI